VQFVPSTNVKVHMHIYIYRHLRYHMLKHCIASYTELQTDLLWFTICSVSQTTGQSIDGTMTSELERIWKEAIKG
jgi:hypothetical protein